MEGPRLIDVGLPEKIVFVANSYYFAKYHKLAGELTIGEIAQIRAELLKQEQDGK